MSAVASKPPPRRGSWVPQRPRPPGAGDQRLGAQIERPTGLRSAARNNKATRLLTRPGPTAKSSAKDLSLARCQIAIRRLSASRFRGAPAAGLLRSGAGAYRYPPTARRGGSPFSGMDSDLEAFSRNPADGSFAALPCRTAAKTNYLNPRFLSY